MLALAYSREFGDGLGDAAGVSKLQRALQAYVGATGDAGANPGPVDGKLGVWTIVATFRVVWKAADKVPKLGDLKKDVIGKIPYLNDLVSYVLGSQTVASGAWSLLQVAKPATADGIKRWIEDHADLLATAITLATGFNANGPPPIEQPATVPFPMDVIPRGGASDGPPGYTLCAQWDSTCSFNGRASVAYGANGVFAYGTFDNSVKCGNDAFGGDPVPNVFKACYVQTSAAGGAAPGGAGGASYKAGSVTRFNTSRNVWSVYSPLAGAGFFGLSVSSDGRCMGGDCLGAAGEVVPPVPVGFVKVGEELAPPAGVVNAGQEQDKGSIWTNPYFWLAAAGGLAAVGTGSYFLLRRKRKD